MIFYCTTIRKTSMNIKDSSVRPFLSWQIRHEIDHFATIIDMSLLHRKTWLFSKPPNTKLECEWSLDDAFNGRISQYSWNNVKEQLFILKKNERERKTNNQGCVGGSWKRKRWKRSFFYGSGSAKILPLPLPHRSGVPKLSLPMYPFSISNAISICNEPNASQDHIA